MDTGEAKALLKMADHVALTEPPEGRHDLSVSHFDASAATGRVIEVGLEEGLRDAEGYYRLTQVDVRPAMRYGRSSSTPRN